MRLRLERRYPSFRIPMLMPGCGWSALVTEDRSSTRECRVLYLAFVTVESEEGEEPVGVAPVIETESGAVRLELMHTVALVDGWDDDREATIELLGDLLQAAAGMADGHEL